MDRRKNNILYYARHRGEKKMCEICNKGYNRFNFNHHTKTKKHLKNAEILKIKNLSI